ncbi:MAG: hypothetical protein KGH58_03550 [Candidatus Micrarchaeota archaeon]|nr:hypothetical protein [Candidatus Micrarchaeota archaeon]
MKTTTKIGIIVILAGIIVLFASGYLANGQLSRQLIAVNITAGPHGFGYTDIRANSSSVLFLAVASSNSSNIYLFNASAFGMWSSAVNGGAGGKAYAATLNGGGQLYTYDNTSFVQLTLPDSARGAGYNYSRVFNGSYYVVIDNTNGSVSSGNTITGRAIYVALNSNTVSRYAGGLTYDVLGALAVIIAGVAVLAYGFVRKRKDASTSGGQQETKSNTTSKEYIDSLYKDIEGKKAGTGRKGRARKRTK